MGTWAAGNFDNDGALDYLAEVMDSLQMRIEDTLADEDLVSLDEDGETVLMPSIHITALLCERCHGAPPKADIVRCWREKYLQVFDEQIDGLQPHPDFKTQRREIIKATFDDLEQQARAFWKS
jgi:hypothetical protein